MPKLVHVIVNECCQCPYYEIVKNRHYCSAPNRFIEVKPHAIHHSCPLPETTALDYEN